MKFGTNKLFDEGKRKGEKEYTDLEVDKLCDRKQQFLLLEESERKEGKKKGVDEYLGAFEEAKMEESKDEDWEKLLGDEIEQMKMKEIWMMGRDMRNRGNNINYAIDGNK